MNANTMKRVPMAEATEAQLREFAQNVLGLAIDHKTKGDKRRAAIGRAWPNQDHILVADTAPPAEAPAPALDINHTAVPATKAMVDRTSGLDPKVKINISREAGPGGDRAVPVSVNGVAMVIPRGEDVTVPYRFYLALRNAITTLVEQDPNTLEEFRRDTPSYPFQVVGPLPSEAEIAAWSKKVAAA
jgi:hypothetical protein